MISKKERKILAVILASIFSLSQFLSNQASATEILVPDTAEEVLVSFPSTETKIIEGSYIVTFKEGAGVIDLPDPENAGKVPVGQPSSGQSKEELAATLGLNGEIIGSLEVNNGIVVKMNAQEAERRRLDGCVLHVNQSMEDSFMAVDDSKAIIPLIVMAF